MHDLMPYKHKSRTIISLLGLLISKINKISLTKSISIRNFYEKERFTRLFL
jgi:hypothetical protein